MTEIVTLVLAGASGVCRDDEDHQAQRRLPSPVPCGASLRRPLIDLTNTTSFMALQDDKGSTLIVVFGVPPFAHEDDPYRAVRALPARFRSSSVLFSFSDLVCSNPQVKTSLEMREALLSLGIDHAIGVTTGNVYVGSVGSPFRQEHAVVGDVVRVFRPLPCFAFPAERSWLSPPPPIR